MSLETESSPLSTSKENNMLGFVLGIVIGLVIGWNLLPQPQWAKNLWDKFTN